VTFTTEDLDRDAAHDTVTNTSRYTAQTAGYYWVSGNCAYASNATGGRGARLAVNGTALNNSASFVQAVATANPTAVPLPARLVFLAVNDFLELQGMQTSGGALNSSVSSDIGSALAVAWMGS
jgi:hypothetical protein